MPTFFYRNILYQNADINKAVTVSSFVTTVVLCSLAIRTIFVVTRERYDYFASVVHFKLKFIFLTT